MNKLGITLLLTAALGYACRSAAASTNVSDDYQSLVAAGRAFSAFTGKHGIRAGFTDGSEATA
jgi:hypothetical protein